MVRTGFLAAIAAVIFVFADGSVSQAEARTQKSLPDLIEDLSPAVVNISSSQRVNGAAPTGELAPLQRKFGRQAVSLGSGFVIDAKGIVRAKFPWADAETIRPAVEKIGKQ